MNKLTNVIMFIFGAGVGSAATWYFLKSKYEAISNEERNSYKEYYEKKVAELTPEPEEQPNTPDPETFEKLRNKPDISEYTKQYVNYSDVKTAQSEPDPEEEEKESYSEKPYVITPEEFGEDDEYKTISLLYFADEVLTDDDYAIIENVDDVVGRESLKTFGKYEDDAVYVRNDRLKCEYEILLDERHFEDIKLARMRNGLD